MARSDITYGDWRVTSYRGKACATTGTGADKRRITLKDPAGRAIPEYANKKDKRSALISFVNRQSLDDLRAELTIEALWSKYVEAKEREGRPSAAIFRSKWKALSEFFAGIAPFDVNDKLCMDYVDMRAHQGMSQATVYDDMARLQVVLNWGKDQRLYSDKIKVWHPSRGQPRQRVVTPDEFLTAIEAVDPRAPHGRTILMLALLTAARKSAILELKWSQVDFDARLIRYKPEDVRTWNPKEKGYKKGRATVPLGDVLFGYLWEIYEDRQTEYVVEYNGSRVADCKRVVEAIMERAGIEGVTLHTLRHTAATWAANSGIATKDIADTLGHANDVITNTVYIHRDSEHMRPVVAAIEGKLIEHRRAAE